MKSLFQSAGSHLMEQKDVITLPSLQGDAPVCVQMAESVMTAAYDSGVNLFDTAEVYASGR